MTNLTMPAYEFPREMPTLVGGHHPFSQASFDPLYTQVTTPTWGGRQQVANVAPDLWAMTFATHEMEYEPAIEYLAWLQSLRGGARLFKAWHPLRRYPLAYSGSGWTGLSRAGGGAFDGVAEISAIGTGRDTLTISTLPADFQFSIGDMVSFEMGASRSLHRLMAAETASNGGSATIAVEPMLPLAVVVGAEVLLEKAWCLAVVDAKSIRGPFQRGQIARVSFSARQTF